MLKILKLTKSETEYLLKNKSIAVARNGLDILVEYNNIYNTYDIFVVNPYSFVKLYDNKKEKK